MSYDSHLLRRRTFALGNRCVTRAVPRSPEEAEVSREVIKAGYRAAGPRERISTTLVCRGKLEGK
jgi:hypothetical protein